MTRTLGGWVLVLLSCVSSSYSSRDVILVGDTTQSQPRVAVIVSGKIRSAAEPLIYQTFLTNIKAPLEGLGYDVDVFMVVGLNEEPDKIFPPVQPQQKAPVKKWLEAVWKPRGSIVEMDTRLSLERNEACPSMQAEKNSQEKFDFFNQFEKARLGFGLQHTAESSGNFLYEWTVRIRTDTVLLSNLPSLDTLDPAFVYVPSTGMSTSPSLTLFNDDVFICSGHDMCGPYFSTSLLYKQCDENGDDLTMESLPFEIAEGRRLRLPSNEGQPVQMYFANRYARDGGGTEASLLHGLSLPYARLAHNQLECYRADYTSASQSAVDGIQDVMQSCEKLASEHGFQVMHTSQDSVDLDTDGDLDSTTTPSMLLQMARNSSGPGSQRRPPAPAPPTSYRHTLGSIETKDVDPFTLEYLDDFGGFGTFRYILLFFNRVMHTIFKPPPDGGSMDPHIEGKHWIWMWACCILVYSTLFHEHDSKHFRNSLSHTIVSLF